jgi:hypothetical protein
MTLIRSLLVASVLVTPTHLRTPVRPAAGRVQRYRCFVHDFTELLCQDPIDGRLFRPERRFDQFIVEVPSL